MVYNSIRIVTLDRFLFPEFKVNPDSFQIYRRAYPFRENKVDISGLSDVTVKKFMNEWFNWTQEEFLIELKSPCYIEPRIGWAIVPPNRLFYYSLGISRTKFLRRPDFISWLKKKQVVEVTKAISLRDTGEENYFHFYNDVLAKIFFLKTNGVDLHQYPIIIARALWEKPYFQHVCNASGFLKSLQWIVQDKQYLHCQSVIFCKPLTHRKDLWETIFSPLEKKSTTERAIFLTRGKRRLRTLTNSTEIEAIARDHNFDVVDCDDLSLARQIELFAGARMVVGIHGSGLTNIYFSNGPCKVLEIFPPPAEGYLPFHYIMTAAMKGFQYGAMIGENGRHRWSGEFYVDPSKFEKALKQLLTNTGL